MKPHLVKSVENPVTQTVRTMVPKPSGAIGLKQADIDVVKRALENVVASSYGTAYKIFRGAPYTAAGKTGTAQVYSLKGSDYRAHAIGEQLRDHALFIAFAPVERPQIALALIVENGGWGAQAAGPIARAAFDYYLGGRHEPLPAAPRSAPTSPVIAAPPLKQKEPRATSVVPNGADGSGRTEGEGSTEKL